MDFLSGILLGFTLVLTRVGAFFSVFPLFSWKVIPMRLKVAMILVAGFFQQPGGLPRPARGRCSGSRAS
jgi:flagellar biosynthesis protein FliR